MEVIKSDNFNNINIGPLVLAVGTFDGIHLGHQAVINKAKEIAESYNLPHGVYTFNPHPLEVLKPALAPKSIISSRQKIELLSNFNLDYYLEQKFTMDFARINYQAFTKDYLVDRFKISHLVVGEDFHLGDKGKGNVKSLKKMGFEFGFEVTGLDSIKKGRERISSTCIRNLIEEGKISDITDYLGRYYRLDGKVIKGMGRGHKLGIPTANLKPDTDYVLPPSGVYACYVLYNGKKYQGIVNFGNNPTFAGTKYSIEVHIFDFEYEDIYQERISIDLVDFIREEMTFSSPEELVKQIKKDILYTESLLCYN
ncbi:MAG: bifunctional riboflavin kinase/FAD synthetase [Halanaerobiales bacterium]